MNTPLHRLYKTKLALLATVVTVLGAGLLLVAHALSGRPEWTWLAALPVTDVGSALFTTGLIAIFFGYLDQEDADERANQRLRKVLREEAPAIRDAVVDGFAFQPEALTNVASPDTLDRVVQNCLAIRLDDKPMADEIYADLRQQLIGSKDRWRDVHVSVVLSPWSGGPATGKGAMYAATVTWEYRTVPSNPVMRFSCVSDMDEYHDLLRDPSSTIAWYFQPVAGLDGASPESFELVHFAVDGRPRPARRTKRAGTQTYAVTLDSQTDPKQEVTVSYTYRVLVQKHGHLLHVDLAQPTNGLKVRFAYAGCGIRYVSVLDHLAGSRPARISKLPASDPAPSVELSFDGWAFPKSGVGFVWVLEEEMRGYKKDPELSLK